MSMTDLDRRQAERRANARQEPAGGRRTVDKPRPATAPARSKGDRWATFNAFVDGHLGAATSAEVRVWMVIYREVRPGGLAHVGMSDIARRAGLTRRGVVKAINGLKRRGMVELVTRGSVNGSPNAYRVAMPAV